MKIAKLVTKENDQISIRHFTVLVGPNNVGKSQTLRDIHQRMEGGRNARTTIIKQIQFAKPSHFQDLLEGLKVVDDPQHADMQIVRGIKSNLTSGDNWQFNPSSLKQQYESQDNVDFLLGNLSRFRVSYLDASSRLAVARSCGSHNPHVEPPQNLLQGLFGGPPENEEELRKAFKEMFGMDILLDYSGMTQLVLRVAKAFAEIPEDPRKAYPVLNKFSTLDTQGDGFKSFVGVVLSLLMSRGRLVLLDEPEAFLHPAQARQLGFWIAEHSKRSAEQIIVATHNSSFLSGILASDQPVDIFRLNRTGDRTTYTLIPSEATADLAKSPLLSSQRVLESIFFRGVAVCEADADRAVYQTVAVRDLEEQEVLFVHAHNKQTIHRVVSLLKPASIPVCAIVDIDILNSSTDLEQSLRSLGNSPDIDRILEFRQAIAREVEGEDEEKTLNDLTQRTSEFLAQLNRNEHTLSGARGALNRLRRESSKWRSLKEDGIEGAPAEIKPKVKELLDLSKKSGLFILPVGELESWLDLGTRQKNRWIVLALERLHSECAPTNLKHFLKEALAFLESQAANHSLKHDG